jgi:hypothetical protein
LSSEYGFEGFLSDEEASTKAATKGTKQGSKKPNSRKVLKTNDAEDVKEEEAKSQRVSAQGGASRAQRNKSKPAVTRYG